MTLTSARFLRSLCSKDSLPSKLSVVGRFHGQVCNENNPNSFTTVYQNKLSLIRGYQHVQRFATFPICYASKVAEERSPVDENVSFRKIRELDEYKSIFKLKEDRTMLDKVANIVLKKNIKVPEVSLMASEKYFWTATYYHGRSHIKHLDKLKTASFTPDDDDKIMQNLENVMKTLKVACKGEFYKELFSEVADEHHKDKVNIVGHFLSLNMKDPRLASEVFYRAKLILTATKGQFSEEESEVVKNYIENAGEDSEKPWEDLSKVLGRPAMTIKKHFERVIQHKCKTVDGKFSFKERCRILEKIMSQTDGMGDNKFVSYDVFDALGAELNRNPNSVQHHWTQIIHPLITRYEADVLDVDFRFILIDYLVENGITFSLEADWNMIVKDPRFHGTTPAYLSHIHKSMIRSTTRKYSSLKRSQVTSDIIKKFMETGSRCRKPLDKSDIDLLEFYKEAISK